MSARIKEQMKVALCAPQQYWDEIGRRIEKESHVNVTRVHNPEELHLFCEENEGNTLFFPHWSWILPEPIYTNRECIMFHMTDLPYGRGGTPLQNLIARGVKDTKITAFKCEKEIDAGPIYTKKAMSLAGNADQILSTAANIVGEMIIEILIARPAPYPQVGEAVYFDRRKPHESRIDWGLAPNELYDHIRMLDADYYPRAFMQMASYNIEFSNVAQERNGLTATVTITQEAAQGDV